jgi:hypothetical protein
MRKQTPGPTEPGTRYGYVTRRTGTHGELVINALLQPHSALHEPSTFTSAGRCERPLRSSPPR